ncbi:MAG: ABC transporter permease [candidate division NC10 bacterium]|nr:ABC transporter permease [candidate division NC10 bacterium]
MTEVLDIAPWRLAAALLLIAVVFVLSFRERLGLERSLLMATVRTFLQLFLVGYVLRAIFALEHWAPVLGAVAVMVLVATHTAVSRLKRRVAGITAFAAIALTAGSGLTLVFVTEVVIGVRPWFDPQYVIPIAGMIVGNAMNGAALAGERFQAELKNRVPEVETLLALGFPAPEALAGLRQEAIRAALIPRGRPVSDRCDADAHGGGRVHERPLPRAARAAVLHPRPPTAPPPGRGLSGRGR